MSRLNSPMVDAAETTFPYHYESSALVATTPGTLFEHVDDHARLASHMSRSSWMMGGGRMDLEIDAGKGRKVGSHIRVGGRVFGIQLALDEVVTEYDPPRHKAWETVGKPRLLVIGGYRMGFDITPHAQDSFFRVYIDYALPSSAVGRVLGRVFGRYYARWCTARMVNDAVRHFVSIANT